MIRHLVWMSLALAGLSAWNAVVDRRSAETRLASGKIERLVPEDIAQSIAVAALKFREPARNEELVYVRQQGVWRCLSALGAIARSDELTDLLGELTGARGVLRTSDPKDADEYGFGRDNVLSVSFHGPKLMDAEDEDVLLAFDIGASLPGALHRRSFVRPSGTNDIYEIDRDPRRFIERPATRTIPPMTDRRVLGGPWSGRARGFRRILVELADGTRTEIVHEERDPTPGEPAWQWRVTEGTRSGVAPPHRSLGFTAFALTSQFSGFANPKEAEEHGLVPAVARVTLEPMEPGDAGVIQLVIGRNSPQGATAIFNRQTKMLMQVDAETARLYVPNADMLLDPEVTNPWELWLSGR